ncbi:MAG TPA: urate hydroxylase PuuD [Gemmatimonadales bacterium]
MDAHLAGWLGLALRWGHVITGIAWIGTSFYFNWLNSRMALPSRAEAGVSGELWSVHGGGFYRVVKYSVAPERLPQTLHWFKWEAYFTWFTGFLLLVLIYYLQADAYLVRPGISGATAVAVGLATLLVSWLVYDVLCRSPLAGVPAALGAAIFLLFTALAWALTQVMSPRAAYLHMGAAIGTIMAANVFAVIIPSQRRMVDALSHGRAPDGREGLQAALRSLHNNYFTLPVVFTMVSGHSPGTYGHAWGWAILAGLALVGVGTRHWFNLRNQGRRAAWLLPAAGLGLATLAFLTAPSPAARAAADDQGVSFGAVRVVIAQRCAPCHSSAPTLPGFTAPAAGIAFDTPDQIRGQAERIQAVAVAAETMPLGNLTEMTADERALIGRWVRGGAALR